MPRTIPAALETELNKKQGIEPVYLFEIAWNKDGQVYEYSTKKDANIDGVRGGVLQIGTVESVVKLDQKGQSQAIDLTLSDVDAELKGIIDNTNIHGSPVSVYLWESSLPETERVLLMQGEINGPIKWSEGDRTLGFQVVTKLADEEVGFSPEQGLFPGLPDSLAGKPWPMVFGTVQNVPCPRLQEIPRTTSATLVGATDPTLSRRISELNRSISNWRSLLIFYAIALGTVEFSIDFEGRTDLIGIRDSLQSAVNQFASNIANATAERSQLSLDKADQDAEQQDSFQVTDASVFPEGETLKLIVDDIEFTGSFAGETFNITSRRVLSYDELDPVDTIVDPFGFTYADLSSTVKYGDDVTIQYVANLLSSDLDSLIVRAYRGSGANRALSVVPSSFYTASLVPFGDDFTITMIEFPTPLSNQDEEFEDDIFVTQTCPIGPNTVDILEYLIDTFTELDKDAASFADLQTKLENYPSHFALLTQWNVLDLIESILFQSRCAGFISNNTVFLKYLAEPQTATAAFTDADVDAGSITMLSTPFEEVSTKLVAEWTDDLAQSEPNRLVLRHNVPLYGLRERTENFFIYNIPELVLKSATFWLIRFANIWKRAEFTSFLNKLDVETFDTVDLQMTGDLFATGSVDGIITDMTIDTVTNKLSVEAWMPVKFGTMEPYVFSWPSDASIAAFFPTDEELDEGLGGSASPQKDVEGDLEFDFGGTSTSISVQGTNGTKDRSPRRRDTGDPVPSDIDDVKPEPSFSIGSSVGSSDKEEFDSVYGVYEDPTIVEEGEGNEVFAGIVTGGQGDVYQVDIYFRGLENAPTNKDVKQLQIGSSVNIPVGSKTLVKREIHKNEDEVDIDSYFMQVPVWL